MSSSVAEAEQMHTSADHAVSHLTRAELHRVCPKSRILAETRRDFDEPLDYGAAQVEGERATRKVQAG